MGSCQLVNNSIERPKNSMCKYLLVDFVVSVCIGSSGRGALIPCFQLIFHLNPVPRTPHPASRTSAIAISFPVPHPSVQTLANRSALFNICRKALGHLMKFTQRSIPYRFGLAG